MTRAASEDRWCPEWMFDMYLEVRSVTLYDKGWGWGYYSTRSFVLKSQINGQAARADSGECQNDPTSCGLNPMAFVFYLSIGLVRRGSVPHHSTRNYLAEAAVVLPVPEQLYDDLQTRLASTAVLPQIVQLISNLQA